MNVALLRYRSHVVAGNILSKTSNKFIHGRIHLRHTATTAWLSTPWDSRNIFPRDANNLKILRSSYSSSSARNTDHPEEAVAIEYSPRELRAKLLESKDNYDFKAWRDLLRYTVSLGKDGSYIMEEMLTKVLQSNDIRSVFSVVRILAIHQMNYKQEHSGILGSTDHRGGPSTISVPLLSTTAAFIAESVHWEALKWTIQLLIMHSSFSAGRTGPVDIPDRLLNQLLAGLLSKKNGAFEVLDFVHFVVQQKREDIFRSIDFTEVERLAAGMGGPKINSSMANEEVENTVSNVMKAWLDRYNNDGVISASVAKFVVAFAVAMDLETATTDFVRKVLDACQKEHQMMNSFLVDKPFSLRNWADNHPLSLLEGFTTCIHQHIKLRQRYNGVHYKENNYNSLYHEVNFELLRQAVPLFSNAVFQLRPSTSDGLAAKEGTAIDWKHLNWADLGQFFPIYWHLEHMARGASILKPSAAERILSLPVENPAPGSPKTTAERYEFANETITVLYDELRSFLEDTDEAEVQFSVSDGYTRRNLRYLCDALRLEHAPIYDTPETHQLDNHEDDDDGDGDEDWRVAKRKRSQQQHRKKESSSGDRIIGFRIRKSAALWDSFASRDEENETVEFVDENYSEMDPSAHRKRTRNFVFTIPTLKQLMKEDMRGAFLGDPDAVVLDPSQASTIYRDTYRFQPRPLFWTETLQTLDRLSDRELSYMAIRIASGSHVPPTVSNMLLFADYVSETRNIPLPLTFISVLLRMCERGKDLYGLLETLYLVQREAWKKRHDVDFQKNLHAFRRYAGSKDVDGEEMWDVVRLNDVQWAQVMTIASKSMKYMTWNHSLYPTMLELLALQKQLGRSELSPSAAKNLLIMFSTFIQRDSPFILKLAERNLTGHKHSAADKVEIVALSNFLRQKMVTMVHTLRLPSRAMLISMARPVFKQNQFLRIKPQDVHKILSAFMVSTVTDPRENAYFNRRLWRMVTRHTNLHTTSSGRDDRQENFVQVVRLRRQRERTDSSGDEASTNDNDDNYNNNGDNNNGDNNDDNNNGDNNNGDNLVDDTDELTWQDTRRELLDFVSRHIEQHHRHNNTNSGDIDHYNTGDTPATPSVKEKRDRKGRLISTKPVKSTDALLREYRKEVAVVLGQTYMALLASYLATTHSATAEVLYDTHPRKTHNNRRYNNNNNNNNDEGDNASSAADETQYVAQEMALNERATRLLLMVARHQERVLADPRLALLREKNKKDFVRERESGFKREFHLLDILRDNRNVQKEYEEEEEEEKEEEDY